MLIVNPHATTTTEAGLDVIAAALSSELKLDVVATTHRGHASELAVRAGREGYDLVVAHGGDGTVNEVVNGLLVDGQRPETPALGVVPGGAANVFGAALGIPRDPVDATRHLLRALRAGRRRTIGLGRVRAWDPGHEGAADPLAPAPRWFTFNSGLGLDAAAVRRVEHARAKGKKATTTRYVRAALISYLRQDHKRPLLTVELPGEEPITGVHLAIVANSDPYSYLGTRPVRMNPGCAMDGGLGLFALHTMALPTVLRHVGQILRASGEPHGGKLDRRQDLSRLTVTAAEPIGLQVDGDYLGEHTRADFEAVPAALAVTV
ncbi:MAG TPA: diacylglycerol kinase family protein [Pseudonocardiaceae bacterium]